MNTTTLMTILVLTTQVLLRIASLAAMGSTSETKLALATSPAGRVVLHLLCAWRDHRFHWHWQGVLREVGRTPARIVVAQAATRH